MSPSYCWDRDDSFCEGALWFEGGFSACVFALGGSASGLQKGNQVPSAFDFRVRTAPSLYAKKFPDMVATQSVKPIDLLIVDDEPDFLEPACRFFQRQGYRVVAAANAEQALAVQAKQHFHLAVIDQNMPDARKIWQHLLVAWQKALHRFPHGFADEIIGFGICVPVIRLSGW